MKISQKQLLRIFFIIAILNVILIEFILADIPELFQFGNKIGIIMSQFSLAYISSYIFYLIVVVMKEKKDRKNIYTAVHALTERMLNNGYSVYSFLLEAAEEDPKNYDRENITKEEYLQICAKADLHKFPKSRMLGNPMNLKKVNFAQFIFNNSVNNLNFYSEKIFTYMPFLDSEFVKLINDLHQTIFYIRFASILPMAAPSVGINPNIANSMFEYFDLIRKLDNYNKNKNAAYFKI